MQSKLTLHSSLTPDSREAGREHPGIQCLGFPGGERHVRLPESVLGSTDRCWMITAGLYSAEGVMELLLLSDALKRAIPVEASIHLQLPYVPYARQDRVAVEGEPLSAAVFCQLINSAEFASVTVSDPHSDVVSALLKNVRIIPAAHYVQQLREGALAHVPALAVVAPDAGARKRVETVAKAIGAPVVYASKRRNPLSGKLSDAAVESELPELPLLVVDDICDGGGTFIALAAALRERSRQSLYLYVTHGLFTKGLAPLTPHFDAIFTPFCADPALAEQTCIHRAKPA
ncbi:ribose-phosphate pyrophosphokinase [Paucibacter oligotrophus]|uniref:Ribose-phosphate pyrophosphokinase n=1 Tax=Roseateles oligotrophus TaxID=1769250 RepID=A0A840LDX2_9BURK|nr:ribose-phosphate diphosphokinase [Roseateles oligotrophus]MBB4845901.1 ribose-phosphate pyrophosphokinase [Roseateles oligotrophus]